MHMNLNLNKSYKFPLLINIDKKIIEIIENKNAIVIVEMIELV